MTHPSVHARTQPDKIAYQMAGSGKAITYRELDELSNQGAHLFRSLGLKAGDHIAFLMVGNVAKAKWTKLKPTASPTEIVAMLHLLAGNRLE